MENQTLNFSDVVDLIAAPFNFTSALVSYFLNTSTQGNLDAADPLTSNVLPSPPTHRKPPPAPPPQPPLTSIRTIHERRGI